MTKDNFNKELFRILIKVNSDKIKDIAKSMDVSYVTIHSWINGFAKPTVKHLKAISKYFDIKMNEFIKPVNTDEYNNYLILKYEKEYITGGNHV